MLGNTRFFIGQIENNDDTQVSGGKGTGRVQVRVFGVHDPNSSVLPTSDLPWALCIMPNNFGGVAQNGTVPPPQLQKGAWVLGISLDETYNSLIVLGSIVMPRNMADLANAGHNAGTDSLMGNAGMLGNAIMGAGNGNCSEAIMNANMMLESSVSFTNLTDAQNVKSNQNGMTGAGQVSGGALKEMFYGNGDKISQEVSKAMWVAASQGLIPGMENMKGKSFEEFKNLSKTSAAVNKAVSCTYMEYCLKSCGGNPLMAFASYNEGVYGGKKFEKWVVQNKNVNPYTITDASTLGQYYKEWFADPNGGWTNKENQNHLKKLAEYIEKNPTMKDCMEKWAKGESPFLGSTPMAALALQKGGTASGDLQSIADRIANYAREGHTHAELQAYAKAQIEGYKGLAAGQMWCMEFIQAQFEANGLGGILPKTYSSTQMIQASQKQGLWVDGSQVTLNNISPMDLVVWNGHGQIVTGVNYEKGTVQISDGNWYRSSGNPHTGTREVTIAQLRQNSGFGIAKYSIPAAEMAKRNAAANAS